MEAQAVNLQQLKDLAKQLEEATVTYVEAAELLGVHEAYARRIIADDLGESMVTIHGKPLVPRVMIVSLAEQRKSQVQERASQKQVRETEKQERARQRLERAKAILESANGQAEPA